MVNQGTALVVKGRRTGAQIYPVEKTYSFFVKMACSNKISF